MKLLLLLTLLPLAGLAQEVPGFTIKEVQGKFVAVPEALQFRLNDNSKHTQDFCEAGLITLKDVVADHKRYRCDQDKENIGCRGIFESVKTFATLEAGSAWGSPKNSFSIEVILPNTQVVRYDIARDLGVDAEKVIVRIPDLKKVTPKDWKDLRVQPKHFYQKIADTFGYQDNITMDRNGTTFFVSNRLQYCAVKAGALRFEAVADISERVSVPAPQKETQELNDLYQTVLKDWEKLEEKKWQNSLHKMLYAGSILKQRLDSEGKEPKLEKYFDKFFVYYTEDEAFSVHIHRFKNLEEFTAKVNPPHVEEVAVTLTLKQQG